MLLEGYREAHASELLNSNLVILKNHVACAIVYNKMKI